MLIKTKKAQVLIIDALFFALVVIFLVYLETQYISDFANNEININKKTKDLETILFTDKLISNCDYLAKSATNHESLCYQNIINIYPILENKIIYELKENNICKITISGNVIYNTNITSINSVIERGVIYNNAFTTIKFYICK